jgi:predicted phage gp36 major capsid-like protein
MIDPAWIALIGTVTGGVGLKAAEHYLSRSKVASDDATRIRDELRLQIADLKEENKGLEARLEATQKEWLDLRDKYMQVTTELTIALEKLKKSSGPSS